MAATNSAFRTEPRDEHLYNHIELFNRSSSPIDAPAANRYQDCREQQPTEKQIATGRRMFSDYRTEPNNEHLYYNIQSINNSPATESQAANQTSQDDRRGQQPTGTSKTYDGSACVICYDGGFGLSLPGHVWFIDSKDVGTGRAE